MLLQILPLNNVLGADAQDSKGVQGDAGGQSVAEGVTTDHPPALQLSFPVAATSGG